MTFTPDSLKSLLLTLQTADIELVVVDGQAINLWAMQYAQSDPIRWPQIQQRIQDRRDRYKRLMER